MALVTLSGCSKNLLNLEPTEVVVNEPTVVVLPDPHPVKLYNINWEVIIVKDPDGTEKVYFALSPGDYENLSLNMAEILRWISEAQWQLRYYQNEVNNNGNERGRDQANRGDDSS